MILDVASPSLIDDIKSDDNLLIIIGIVAIILIISVIIYIVKKNKKTLVIKENGLSYFTFDSKWYTEICNNNDFKVSGHFRLQPYGDGSRRLIFIKEFVKHGYHRKASIDKVKDGELSID